MGDQKSFHDIFGFTPAAGNTNSRPIAAAIVVAYLAILAKNLVDARREVQVLVRKYSDMPISATDLTQARQDLESAISADKRVEEVERDFVEAVQVANAAGFVFDQNPDSYLVR